MANGKRIRKQKLFNIKINTSWKNLVLYGLVFLFLAFVFVGTTAPTNQAQKTVPLSQVIKDVKDGKVTEIEVHENKLVVKEKDTTIQTFKEPGSNVYSLFKDAGVNLDKTKVVVNDQTGMNNWVNLIASVLPIILMVAFFWFIFRQARGAQENIFSFGKSSAKLFSKDTPKTTFKDVAGVDEAKQELTEIVD